MALIGCGGRGNGAISDCLNADPAVRVVAVADAFEDKVKLAAQRLRKNESFAQRVDLPPERVFAGLDAYQKALDAGIDMIVTATPPGFRPMIYAAAIKAGKHVFMEKPCCVDAPGFRQLMETNKLAEEKGLKVGVGFQRRHSSNVIETINRIHDGAIGKLMYLRAYYNCEGIWNRPRAELAKTLKREPTEMEFQVHNWYHFCWLSGDNICEQHIHDIDVCNWVHGGYPIEANGMGGCTLRYVGRTKGTGQIFDHHFVEFTYPDGAKLFSQCRQMLGCFNRTGVAAHGTEGESDCSGYIKGKTEWTFSGAGRGRGQGQGQGQRQEGPGGRQCLGSGTQGPDRGHPQRGQVLRGLARRDQQHDHSAGPHGHLLWAGCQVGGRRGQGDQRVSRRRSLGTPRRRSLSIRTAITRSPPPACSSRIEA